MDDDTIYKADPGVISTRSGGELVLLSLTSETYYGLNAVGARIWDMLQDGASIASLVDGLDAEYDADRAQLRVDAQSVMRDLLSHGLVAPEVPA